MTENGGDRTKEPFDLLIVGGGVNGTGIARDAAGRGLSVLLCEKDDLASATSSASTKLIHGGLRYLEQYDFSLVRESLTERERLLRCAPHIIRPMRFVLPHHDGLRPAWMLRLGLFLYDHLGPRSLLPATEAVDLRHSPPGAPLRDRFRRGFVYSDCWVDDARLVLLLARQAAELGADIRTRTRCLGARRAGGLWKVRLAASGGEEISVHARALVNAAGPWVAALAGDIDDGRPAPSIRLVKGSHIVLPRLFDGDHAFIFQNDDGRVVFAIPYEESFTLVGTTDVPVAGDPGRLAPSQEEIAYLCRAVNAYLERPAEPAAVHWAFAGVRPLHDEDGAESPAKLSRDYALDLDAPVGGAPLLTVLGGKITTFRKLAEEAVTRLGECLGTDAGPWTDRVPLPGGDIPHGDFAAFTRTMARRYPWLEESVLLRLLRAYGTRTGLVIGEARKRADLGRHFGAGLYEVELDHMRRHEWARTADDALWRRSKRGLHLDASARTEVADWFGGGGHGR